MQKIYIVNFFPYDIRTGKTDAQFTSDMAFEDYWCARVYAENRVCECLDDVEFAQKIGCFIYHNYDIQELTVHGNLDFMQPKNNDY